MTKKEGSPTIGPSTNALDVVLQYTSSDIQFHIAQHLLSKLVQNQSQHVEEDADLPGLSTYEAFVSTFNVLDLHDDRTLELLQQYLRHVVIPLLPHSTKFIHGQDIWTYVIRSIGEISLRATWILPEIVQFVMKNVRQSVVDNFDRSAQMHNMTQTMSLLSLWGFGNAVDTKAGVRDADNVDQLVSYLKALDIVLRENILLRQNDNIVSFPVGDLIIGLPLALMGNTVDATVRGICKPLLKTLLDFDQKCLGSRNCRKWCSMIWDWIMASSTEENRDREWSNVLVLDILSRNFDYFFGLKEEVSLVNEVYTTVNAKRKTARSKKKSTTHHDISRKVRQIIFGGLPAMGKDLRFEELFWEIIQFGLLSLDPATRKYSLYLLKRAVDFTISYTEHFVETSHAWPKYFDGSNTSLAIWEEYYTLYDSAQDTASHLMEPILKKFAFLISPSNEEEGSTDFRGIHKSWILLLLHRGYLSDSVANRKKFAEWLFGLNNETLAEIALPRKTVVGDESDEFSRFFFGPFLKVLHNGYMFTVPGIGQLSSPFGESLAAFVTRLIHILAVDPEQQASFLKQLCSSILSFQYAVPVVFILQGLADYNGPKLEIFGVSEIENLKSLGTTHTLAHKTSSRGILKHMLLIAIANFVDAAAVSFHDMLSVIAALHESSSKTERDLIVRVMKERFNGGEEITNVSSKVCTNYLDSLYSLVHSVEFSGVHEMAFWWNLYEVPNWQLLEPILEKTKQIRTHAYMNANIKERIVEFWGEMLSEWREDWDAWLNALPSWAELFADLFEHSLSACLSGQFSDLRTFKLHLQFLDVVFLRRDSRNQTLLCNIVSRPEVTQKLIYNYARCMKMMEISTKPAISVNEELTKIASFSVLKNVFSTAIELNIIDLPTMPSLNLICNHIRVGRVLDTTWKNDWTEVTNLFVMEKWEALRLWSKYCGHARGGELFERCVEEFENSRSGSAEVLLTTLLTFSEDEIGKSEIALLERVLRAGLSLVNEMSKQYLRGASIVNNYLKLVGHYLGNPNLYGTGSALEETIKTLYDISVVKLLIGPVFVSALYEQWREGVYESGKGTVSHSGWQSLVRFQDIFVKLLIFGPQRDKDTRTENAMITKQYQRTGLMGDVLYNPELQNTAELSFREKDYSVRVMMNSLLLHLNPHVPAHQEFAKNIMFELIRVHRKDYPTVRFVHDQVHRTQLRLWCSVTLLVHFIKEDDAASMFTNIFELICNETPISTRYYLEWALVRLVLQHLHLLPLFWERLSDVAAKAYTVTSCLTMLIHLAKKIPFSHERAFFFHAFNNALSWSASNHFTIRAFAQYALVRLWNHCTNTPRLREFAPEIVKPLIDYLNSNAECARNRQKCDELYYLNEFDPFEDLTVEFVFRGLLTVGDCAESERITPLAFQKVDPSSPPYIPFRGTNHNWNIWRADILASDAKIAAIAAATAPTEEAEQYKEPETFIQRKIVPWQSMLESDFDFSRNTFSTNTRHRNPFIVVASLVSKPPNLGGLCRTFEIFNAERLVVDTMKICDDPIFKALCSSANKWMPMEEVRVPDLIDYLERKKFEGYTLVGVEQTTNSIPLDKYEFPEKVVLVLGAEKTGIPAKILSVLDVTIEIPQFGLIRSLNVHVAGSLFGWEYTRQMLNRLE